MSLGAGLMDMFNSSAQETCNVLSLFCAGSQGSGVSPEEVFLEVLTDWITTQGALPENPTHRMDLLLGNGSVAWALLKSKSTRAMLDIAATAIVAEKQN